MAIIMKDITKTSLYEHIELEELAKLIRTDKELKQIGKELKQGTEQDKNHFKRKLGSFSLMDFNGRVMQDSMIGTQYCIYDIGNMDKELMRIVKSKLVGMVLMCFESAGGDGLKFIIKLSEYVKSDTYEINYNYWRDYFFDKLGLSTKHIDYTYKGFTCFLSYDADLIFNANQSEYRAIPNDSARYLAGMDIDAVEKNEILDIVDHLAKSKPTGMDLEIIAFALHRTDNGDIRFKELKAKLKYDDYVPKHITLFNLYAVAFMLGYQRRAEYIQDCVGVKYPFVVKKDGSYYHTDKGDTFVFGWKTFTVDFTLMNEGRVYLQCRIDGHPILIPGESLGTLFKFQEYILKYHPNTPYINIECKGVFDKLRRYIDRIKGNKSVIRCEGIGNVRSNIWNFGNLVLINNRLIPFDNVIWEDESHGYMLDNRTDVCVTTNDNLKQDLQQFNRFYKGYSCLMLGWLVSNLFARKISKDYSGFPMFFVIGETRTGKSSAVSLMQSLYGISTNSDKLFKINLGRKPTANFIDRTFDKVFSFPVFLDEYTDTYYDIIKGLFDFDGRGRAMTTNDSAVKSTEINTGAIVTSKYRSQHEEIINRCVHMDMTNIKSKERADIQDFARLLYKSDMFSGFALQVISRITYEDWQKAYASVLDMFFDHLSDIDDRLIKSYAKVYTGYQLLLNIGMVDYNVSDEWWWRQASASSTNADNSSQVTQFLELVEKMALEGVGQKIGIKIIREERRNGILCRIVQFNISTAYLLAKEIDSHVKDRFAMTTLELSEQVRHHMWCLDYNIIRQYKSENGFTSYRTCRIAYPIG